MKRYLVLLIAFIILILSGCNISSAGIIGGADGPTKIIISEEINSLNTYRIVDGAGTNLLILAGKNKKEVYTLDVRSINVFIDGKKATSSSLKDGMPIKLKYEDITKCYPMKMTGVKNIYAYSLGTKENPGGTYYDLCGLYLKVLEDLWEVDSGLNGNTKYISVDLSKAPGELSDGEKSAISYIFANNHDKQSLELSYEELEKQGYLKGDMPYYFEDGILFSITDSMKKDERYNGLKVIKFNANKWRSGLGAYYYGDCSASWPQNGTWTDYNIGFQAIS